ncbi:MAG: radical SAM protein [Bacteroidales bacterium]|nr:radical SAM protein [Bacteroidales bacterium]
MKFLLITPPLTQLNTPYPATAMLKAFLQSKGYEVSQADLGIELIDRIYSHDWLAHYAEAFSDKEEQEYITRCSEVMEPVLRFLRGEESTLAPRIANRSLLPEGPRFNQLGDLEWAFGTAGTEDRARHLATLFIEDLADFIRDHTNPHFDLIRYAEQIANFAPTFDEMEAALQAPTTCIDDEMLSLLQQHIEQEQPDAVGFAIPFPGCLYGALRCGSWLKQNRPEVRIIFGGGFPNTEWRNLSDERIFDYCDYITLDDGELPQLRLAEFLEGSLTADRLVRTFYRGHLTLDNPDENIPYAELPAPDFNGLPLEKYISLAEMTNPMHRLWSQGRWNKMMMAHGCYWHRCAFCDTSLDYIARYEAPDAATVVDRMERIMAQTGISGFHFVDEALPPKLLREVCEEILRRHLVVSFWGNIRFEKAYTAEMCDLMSDAGCVAVSGGLEVASDRLLRLMDKGVTIGQTMAVCRHFRDSGIMVHTYLMYGFPTETLEETFDALENVRKMFDEGIVQSAFWHRYAMTCHSRSGICPQDFSARRTSEPHSFCNNEIEWRVATDEWHVATDNNADARRVATDNKADTVGDGQFDYDIEEVGRGLRMATFNYMNDLGLDQPIKLWFPGLKSKNKGKQKK